MSGATEREMKALYFAWVRERVGRAEEELDPPPTVDDGRRPCRLALWARRGLRPRVREARGRSRRARSGSRPQRRSDRGGEGSGVLSADDRRLKAMATVRVQKGDFDPGAEAEALARGRTDVGAVVSFVGYCRDEGGRLAALELEHYPGMAEDEIARVARRSGGALAAYRRDRHPSLRPHRAGRADRARRRRGRASRPSLCCGRDADGLPQDPRAVLEAGDRVATATSRGGSKRNGRTTGRRRAGAPPNEPAGVRRGEATAR